MPTAAATALPVPIHGRLVRLTFLLENDRRWTMSFDPDATVGRVKELLWNKWPSGEF